MECSRIMMVPLLVQVSIVGAQIDPLPPPHERERDGGKQASPALRELFLRRLVRAACGPIERILLQGLAINFHQIVGTCRSMQSRCRN